MPPPVFQVAPASVLYSQVAVVSRRVTLTWSLLVSPSLLLAPVSAARAGVGATGARVSMLMAGVVPAPPLLPAVSL